MMLPHFYHGLTEKYVTAFGSLFNDITLVRYGANNVEIKRSKVPLMYGPKEKYLARIQQDPDLDQKVQGTYPMMSYAMLGLQYNPGRKLNTLLRRPKANTVTGLADNVYMGVPYDLSFQLSILARNKEDAWQIQEQILPIFNPNYTFSQILLPVIGFIDDIPLTLDNVTQNIDFESDFDEIMMTEISMDFTMQVNYYGPINRTKIIRRVFANTFLDQSLDAGYIVRVNLTNGNNGDFQIGESVFQGESYRTASATGTVTKWSKEPPYLRIAGAQGDFRIGENVFSTTSNADYTISSFDSSPLKLQSIQVDPDPIDAEPTDTFGYDTTFIEYPETDE